MNRNEAQATLRVLSAIARAGGAISPDEERALEAAAEKLGITLALDAPVDITREASLLLSQSAKVAAFEAAVALTTVDGRRSREDEAMLERLRDAIGIELPFPVVERAARWEERMSEPRERMRAAEIEFLREIARRETELSTHEYIALVGELHRARASALRQELDPALEGRASYVQLSVADVTTVR